MNRKQVRMLRIIDGDTIEVLVRRGLFQQARKERIRLYGMDAPETAQAEGSDSTNHLKKLIGSHRKMWMNGMGGDQYGRTIGLIYRKKNRPEESYNYMMVRDGQARAYMANPNDQERFQKAEEEAARRGSGIWKKKNTVAPWDYRQAERERNKSRSRMKLILVVTLAAIALVGLAYLWLGPAIPQLP
jgi:micrococcal nuclease